MLRNILILLGLLTTCSCVGNQEPSMTSVNLNNGKVVVIFEDCPLQTVTTRFGGTRMHMDNRTIAFVDVNGDRVDFDPCLTGRDTLEIPTYLGYAEMRHMYQVVEYDSYLLQEGDTVLVRYDETARPFLRSLVYKYNTMLYNLPYTLPGAIQSKGFHIETVLTHNEFVRVFNYYQNEMEQLRVPSLRETYRNRYVNLDSLSVVYEQYKTNLASKVDSLFQTHSIDISFYRYMTHRFFPEKRYTTEEVIKTDSLLHYISNYYIAQDYSNVFRESTVAAFDRMAKDTTMSQLAKRGILKRLLKLILIDEAGRKHYSKELKELYRQKYADVTGDSTIVSKNVTKENTVSSSQYILALETTDGQVTSLVEVLEMCAGKMVYLDFWASWCGPCIAQIPYSKALRQRLVGQDIVFLYISTDTSRKNWLDSVHEHADVMSGSYRIQDNSADFLKEIRLEKIPRYLIFDRNGKLVDPDAPRPMDEGVDNTIIAFLNETKTNQQ